MKRLINFSGGRGYYVDDAKVLQEQLDVLRTEQFRGLNNFIIAGCDKSGSDITSGLVCIGGEVHYFPGATGATFPAYLVAGADTGTGDRYYDLDDVTKAAFSVKNAVVTNVDPGGNAAVVNNDGSKRDIYRLYAEKLAGDFAAKTQADWEEIFFSSSTGSSRAFYRKDGFGFVHLIGTFDLPSGAQYIPNTLPEGYRPATNQTFRLLSDDISLTPSGDTAVVQPFASVVITTAGQIGFPAVNGNPNTLRMSVTGVSFKAA